MEPWAPLIITSSTDIAHPNNARCLAINQQKQREDLEWKIMFPKAPIEDANPRQTLKEALYPFLSRNFQTSGFAQFYNQTNPEIRIFSKNIFSVSLF